MILFKRLKNAFGKAVPVKCHKAEVLHNLSTDERALIVYILNARDENVSIGIKHSSADSLITKGVLKELGRDTESRTRLVSVCPKYRESLCRVFYTANKAG